MRARPPPEPGQGRAEHGADRGASTPPKIALITGATRGIGYAAAKLQGERGVTAVIGAREEGRGKTASERLGQPYVLLDVTDADSVQAAAVQIERRYGGLDILINNAGITFEDGLPSHGTAGDARQIYQTNVFGVIEVTNAMLPLLCRSPAGRIVNVSSERGSIGRALDRGHPLWSMLNLAYCSSKAALNMITVSYAKELWDTPVKVNVVDPGWVDTDINHHSGIKSPEEGAAPFACRAERKAHQVYAAVEASGRVGSCPPRSRRRGSCTDCRGVEEDVRPRAGR